MSTKSPTNEYMERILRESLKKELDEMRDQMLSEASDRFNEAAQKIIDERIFRMVHQFSVTSRDDPMRGRQELVIVLPDSMVNKGGE